MPTVSIGLPVYNGENYLKQTIDSLLSQDFTDLELIICDNASTDQTEAICREYVAIDSRVRYYRQDRNVGFARNATRAFELSTGKYFKWSAHDDLHEPSFLSKTVAILDADPSIVLAFCNTTLIDADGREVTFLERGGRQIATCDPPRRLASDRPHHRFYDVIRNTNWVLEFYGLIRSAALRSTLLLAPYFGSDKRLLAELSLMGRFVSIPDQLFLYRYHAAAQTSQPSAGHIQHLHWAGESHGYVRVPRLVNVLGYIEAVRRADVSWAERARCSGCICLWFFQPKKLRGVLAEAARNFYPKAANYSAGRGPYQGQC